MGLGRNFHRIWIASATSQIGDGVMLVALPLVAAKLTGSATHVAMVTVAETLPWLIFGLLSGALADRFDRRRMMMLVDAGRVILMGIFALTLALGWISLPLLYLVAFGMGTGEALFNPASTAIVPMLVADADFERANARLSSTQTLSLELVGPALGGLLFGLSALAPVLLNAASFVASIACVLALRGSFRVAPDEGNDAAPMLSEIRFGVQWLWQHTVLRTLTITQCLMNILFISAVSIMVLLTTTVLHAGEFGFGLILSVGACGGILGTLLAPRLCTWVRGETALVAAMLATGIAFAAVSQASTVLATGLLFGVVSMGAGVANVVIASMKMRLIPAHLMGRVSGASMMLGIGGMPLGAIAGGIAGAQFGVAAVFLVAGVSMALLAVPIGAVLLGHGRAAAPAAVPARGLALR